MLINRLQKLQWIAALTVIVLAAPSHAQSASPPPMKPNEVIVKTTDGCGFVIDNPAKAFSPFWGGACIDGLAMGEGRVSDGEYVYTGFLPSRGWAWYGRRFGASVTRSAGGSSTTEFMWGDKSVSYNTLSTSKPVWDTKIEDGTHYPKHSTIDDGNSRVVATTKYCGQVLSVLDECKADLFKYQIYIYYVVSVFDYQLKKFVDYPCPNPRSPQGCEALWAQHAGPVIERIKAFVAENEPKAEARRREIAPLIASWRPSPQARQNESAYDTAKLKAQLAERAEHIAKMDKHDRVHKETIQEHEELIQRMKEQAAEIAASQKAQEKAQAERSAQDRRAALGILVGAVGQYQQQKAGQRQAQYEEQQRQLQTQQNQQGVSVTGFSQQQISACFEEIKRKQIESQRWGGDVNAVANRLGRFQKELFEGRCAGHPEAQAYIAGANKMLGYDGSASKPSVSQNPVTRNVSRTASSSDAVSRGGPEYVRIQSNVKCAHFKIISEKPVTHTPYKTVVFGIHNTCNAPMYIGWAVYQGQRSTVMVDYEATRGFTPSGGAYFKPRETLKSRPYDFDYSDNPPLKVVFTQVCPIESEASRIAGKPLGNIHARPEQPDLCIGLVLKSTNVPTAN